MMRKAVIIPRYTVYALAAFFAANVLGACASDDPVGFDQGSVTGLVRLAGGSTGVAGVTVVLSGEGGGSIATAADGTFRFNSVPLGSYSLTIQLPDGFEHDPSSPPVRSITMVGGTAQATFIIRPSTAG